MHPGPRTHGTLLFRRALYQLSYQGNSAGRGSNPLHNTKQGKGSLKQLCYDRVNSHLTCRSRPGLLNHQWRPTPICMLQLTRLSQSKSTAPRTTPFSRKKGKKELPWVLHVSVAAARQHLTTAPWNNTELFGLKITIHTTNLKWINCTTYVWIDCVVESLHFRHFSAFIFL